MSLDFTYGSEISEALRNILLCRVKLNAAASVGATNITPGVSSVYPANRFFLNYTNACTIVQPTTANTPTGILHQENVTINPTTTFDGGLTIEFTSALTKSYDTNAYIRPASIPSVCSGLKFIDNDFIPSLNFAPKDEWFPGVLVTRMGMAQEMTTAAGTLTFKYHFRVYYCDKLLDDRNNADTLWDAAETLSNLVLEDNYLAGTVLQSDVVDMLPWYSTEIAQRGYRFVTATHGIDVGWMQFDVVAMRKSGWTKHGPTE